MDAPNVLYVFFSHYINFKVDNQPTSVIISSSDSENSSSKSEK